MKLGVCTLGCKVNTYESEYAIKKFIEAGFELTNFDSVADVYLINTCTVTNTSDQKSRKMIRQARRRNKDAVVAVMGCYTQIRDNDNSIIDDVDVVIGNTNKSNIVNLVLEYMKTKKKILNIEDVMNTNFDNMEIKHFNTRTRALLKIEDGCENYCTYCIIPYVRGKVRSKKPSDVLNEVKELVNNGYKEIVLTGIHTGHYGADLDNYDFSDLLLELNNIDGLERIRISSIEITELNDKFINVLKKSEKIVNHIHIPLQAGSDEILKLMNRKYDLDYFYNKINQIRKVRPEIAITTDVIVGFPGETEQLFNKTMDFVHKVNFAGGHVFPYSQRRNTPAAKMTSQVLNSDKHERSKRLISAFDELENNYYNKYVGKTVNIIPESFNDGIITGHTDNYLKVSCKGCKELIGKDVMVKIDYYDNNKILCGTII